MSGLSQRGGGYPVLFWQVPPESGLPEFAGGKGEPNDPYLISTAEQLNAIGHNPRLMDSHFELIDDLDMTDYRFYPIGSRDYLYRGVFEGNGHMISNLTIEGEDDLGLFGVIAYEAEVKNLCVVDVNITGSGRCVGGLVGYNVGGTVTNCYSTGAVTAGSRYVGGLVGVNQGSVATSYSNSTVTGEYSVGGLVGNNFYGSIANCYSTGAVTGDSRYVGGLVGSNQGSIATCYSTGTVIGSEEIGGLVGRNPDNDIITSSFWGMETSGQVTSAGGTGLTTVEMQTVGTFLQSGWDFVGEMENGTDDIWWILEGQDYPQNSVNSPL